MLTVAQAAEQLNGSEYGREGSKELWAEMKAARLVAVFGASDDLMEFRGAIDDEVGCYNGGTAYVTRSGLLRNDCDSDDCPHFARAKEAATPIVAMWGVRGFSWLYDTWVLHKTFLVKEDGENYCQGIVFALADVPENRPVQGAKPMTSAVVLDDEAAGRTDGANPSTGAFQINVTWHNAGPHTIWGRLAAKLGREPTNAEARDEVMRILSEARHG